MWFSGAIWETPSKKKAVILSHLYAIGLKVVLRAIAVIKGNLPEKKEKGKKKERSREDS